MSVEMIAAVDELGGLGRNGTIPWNVPSDRAHFRSMTMDHALVMGRKTFDSLGQKPLPGRPCAVWTHHPELYVQTPACFFSADIDACLTAFNTNPIFAIGGAQLYQKLLPYTQKIWISRIPGIWQCDVFFPPFSSFKLAWTRPMDGFELECWTRNDIFV